MAARPADRQNRHGPARCGRTATKYRKGPAIRLERQKRDLKRRENKSREKRKAYLKNLSNDFPKAWASALEPVERGSGQGYGDACQALVDIAEAYALFSTGKQFQNGLKRFMVGMRIGELSLGDNFTGVLPWGFIDNRPFLRCMHGYGLSLWRLGRFNEAEFIFERMLWLNPLDNQGVRFLIDDVKSKTAWKDRESQ